MAGFWLNLRSGRRPSGDLPSAPGRYHRRQADDRGGCSEKGNGLIGGGAVNQACGNRKLMADDGPLQLSLFDEQDLAEITSGDFPGQRLIASRNPAPAPNRARTRPRPPSPPASCAP